jgi:hypothetical protein
MNARTLTWTVILLAAAGLLAARATSGEGMGKVYVERTERSFVETTVPPPPGADSEETAQTVWLPASSPEVERYATAEQKAAEISWTEAEQVPPREYFAARAADPSQTRIVLDWPRTIGIWVAAFFTLAIFSFLYRDNPFYRLAEAVVVGVSAGYWMVVGFWDVIVPNLLGKLLPLTTKALFLPGLAVDADAAWWQRAEWAYLVPLALGLMLVWRLMPKGGWISLWPLAFIVGTTAGLRMVGYIEGDFLSQVSSSVIPLAVPVEGASGGVDWMASFWASLANVLLIAGILACLTYFFFSVEHKGAVGKVARVGIWYLMITFGAAFGFTVMGRIALLAARLEFLFDDWLWIIDPTDQRSLAAAAAMLLGG